MTHRFVLIILAAVVANVCAHRVEAEPIKIAGHSMSCGSTPVFSDSSLRMEGRFVPGREIYINQELMQHQPAVRSACSCSSTNVHTRSSAEMNSPQTVPLPDRVRAKNG